MIMKDTNIASVVKAHQAMFNNMPTISDYIEYDCDNAEHYTEVLRETFGCMGKLFVNILYTEVFVYLRLNNGEWQIAIFDTLIDSDYFIEVVKKQPETEEVKMIDYNEFTEFAKEQTGNILRYIVISDDGIVTFNPKGIKRRLILKE